MLTTNVSVDNIAPVELAPSNPTRREVQIYNPGVIALELYWGASLVPFVVLYQYGYCVVVTSLGDPTDQINGLLQDVGPQDIAVSK